MFSFKKDAKEKLTKLPSFEEAVKHLYGEECSYADTVVEVIYSKGGEYRFVVLKSDKGFFWVTLETVRMYDEEEWNYFCYDDRYPAWWEPVWSFNSKSMYGSLDIALSEMKSSVEYKTYFI